jgi:hypothetical protein
VKSKRCSRVVHHAWPRSILQLYLAVPLYISAYYSLYLWLPVCRSICPTVSPSVCPSVLPSFCLSVCLSFLLSVLPSVCPSVCLSVRLSVRLSVCPSVSQSVSPSICPSVCPFVCLSFRLSLSPSVLQSVCPSVCLSLSVRLFKSLFIHFWLFLHPHFSLPHLPSLFLSTSLHTDGPSVPTKHLTAFHAVTAQCGSTAVSHQVVYNVTPHAHINTLINKAPAFCMALSGSFEIFLRKISYILYNIRFAN